MSYARIRNKGGSYVVQGNMYSPVTHLWSQIQATHTDTGTCNDVVGNYKGDNSLAITTLQDFSRTLEGSTPAGWQYQGIPFYYFTLPNHRIGDSLSGTAINAAALKAQGMTNPNRPHVNVPTFIGELKDLPGLIKGAGLKHLRKLATYPLGLPFAKEAANKHLQWRWGLRPMISDVKKMLKFMEAAERRRQEILRLRSGDSIKRSVTLEDTTSQERLGEQGLWNQGCIVNGYRTTTTRRHVWVSLRWVIDNANYPSDIPITSEDSRKEARDLVMGLNTEGAIAAAWELLPWSWLADWFFNFGDLMAAKGNTIPVKPTRTCVMVHTHTVSYYQITKCTNGASVSGTVGGERETKRRTPCNSPTPINPSFVPLLEADKWSILGSLAIQRRKG